MSIYLSFQYFQHKKSCYLNKKTILQGSCYLPPNANYIPESVPAMKSLSKASQGKTFWHLKQRFIKAGEDRSCFVVLFCFC